MSFGMPTLKQQISRHAILEAVSDARIILAVHNPSLRPGAGGDAVARHALCEGNRLTVAAVASGTAVKSKGFS